VLDKFTASYVEAALWASTDNDGEPLDKHYTIDDIAVPALGHMFDDARIFVHENWDLVKYHPSRAGHDFWLTRNRHGAGFWDGHWGEDGDRLTEAALQFAEETLYVGDDGLIYSSETGL